MINTTKTINEESTELNIKSSKPSTDQQIIDMCKQSPTGDIFQLLYDGHWEDAGYQSLTEADEAFCNMLAVQKPTELQINRIISGSGHYSEDWHNNPGYKS